MDNSVCIVLPCYNAAKYINETLESVLNQTYKNIEIIAVDDGSTDDTLRILKTYVPRISVLQHSNGVNRGAAASMNLGINASSTKFVAFLDSDDIFYPRKIEKQIDIFIKHEDIDLVYTNGHAISDEGHILYDLFTPDFKEDNIPGKMLINCYMCAGMSNMMVRRTLLNKVGLFNEKLKYAKDHDLEIRMSEVAKFYYIPEFLMAYRKHPGQQSMNRQQWVDGFTVLDEACKRYPYSAAQKRQRLAVLYYRLGVHDYKSNNLIVAGYRFTLAFFNDPVRAINHLAGKK